MRCVFPRDGRFAYASGGIRGEAPPAPLMYPPTVQAAASRGALAFFSTLGCFES